MGILGQMKSDHLAREALQTRAFVPLAGRERLPGGVLASIKKRKLPYPAMCDGLAPAAQHAPPYLGEFS